MNHLLCLNILLIKPPADLIGLFNSVASLIDSYCLCLCFQDSSIETMITNYFNEKKIVGQIIYLPFINYSQTWSRAFKLATQWGKYILVLDPNMKITINGQFDRTKLIDSMYQIKEHHTCARTHIIRGDCDIQCRALIYNQYYWVGRSPQVPRQIDQLTITYVHPDERSSYDPEMFQHDRFCLKELISHGAEPIHYLYMGYIHQEYAILKNMPKHYHKALKWYRKCLQAKDTIAFLGYYNIGNIYQNLNKCDRAVFYWFEAYNVYPKRAESLYKLVKYYRLKGAQYADFSMRLCKTGQNIPYPGDDTLFIEKGVYEYLLDYDYTI